MRTLWIFRLLSLLLLIIVATKPVMIRPDPGLPTKWAVLLDVSRSMGVKDPVARFSQAKTLAEKILRRFPKFSLFTFSDQVKGVSLDALEKIKASGARSDIANALKETFKNQEYRGAVLLTDGRHVGPGDPVNEAALGGKPLLLVGYGDKTLFKDISIKSVQSPPFSFKNVQTSLSANISVVGYAGKKIGVKLRQKDKVISIQYLQVAGNDVESTVTFQWTPETLGTKVLTVEVSSYAGEFTTSNNKKNVTMDVGRDRFRVLYICGMPGPEYGFLRHQFKADPAVELVTFVILRNASNILNVPEGELSLIPFPTQTVLINQMASFDLIVFEEFSFQKFGLLPTVLHAIRKKVENGGSFLMMGGPTMLGPGSPYLRAGIQEMIPVNFGTRDVKGISDSLPFIPKAPEHPILKLVQNSKKNKDIWKGLPSLDAITLVPGVKPGATVLGTVRYQNKEYPVLTVWKHKKGRVAVLSSRSTWRFSMVEGSRDHASFAYQQFWKNMVLWLTHSDEFNPVRVALEKKDVRLGELETVRVWAYDEYFQPISDVDVKLQLNKPDGSQVELKPHHETKGVFQAPLKTDALGRHSVTAWLYRKGKKFGSDKLRFSSVEGYREEEDLRPDTDHLKELAYATGGEFIPQGDFSLDAFAEFDSELAQKIGKKVLLWNSPWFLACLLILLIGEWFLRKRRGYP